jgi:hypothetical protein
LVVGILLVADWLADILVLVLLGWDSFRAAILDFDFGKYNFNESFGWVFFSADQKKCCILLRN